MKGLREPSLQRSAERVPAGGDSMAIQRAKGLADEVYDVIFNKLMLLEIAPASRITVDNLVRELGVSHTPIREALGRLEGEGLVEKAHFVGYSAAPQISRKRFDELYELRLLLEPYAARHAAVNMEKAALTHLEEIATEMSALGSNNQRLHYSNFARLDAVFHDEILGIAGNQLVRDTLSHLHTHFHIFRLMFQARVTEEALNEHAAMLTAFEHKDGAAAEVAMRDHIARSRERLLQAFAE
jgi:DNA-binding GntR family transcriptional regulator